ncbi:MAG: uroporphyrinogen-III synthase, partial [Acidimicrobiia bacterium]
PCVRVDPAGDEVLARIRSATADADLLLISSARVLDLLWPRSPMPDVPVAVVGKRTASAVTDHGGRVAFTGTSGLAALLGDIDFSGSTRVVFPHAAGSDRGAIEALRRQAPVFRDFVAYRSVPLAPPPTEVEAVAFSSPSAIDGWLLSRTLDGLVVGVIGPTTAAALARHRAPDVVAPQPSHELMARAMASYLEVSV